MTDAPIEGQVLVLTAAKASVPASRLPGLIERVQRHLAADRGQYRREYERLHATETIDLFLVEPGHWESLGASLGFDDRELAAVHRAHEEQLLRIGRRIDRETAFETALDVREPVCISREDGDN